LFKSRQFIIGLVISLIFLAWALSNEPLDQVWNAVLRANYWSLIPALALYFTGVWIRAIRWRILLKPLMPRITLNRTFEVVTIGYMANNILPARIGELVRAYVLSRSEGVRKTTTLATILVERIFDGLIMVGFAASVILFVILFDRDMLSTGQGHNLGTLIQSLDWLITASAVAFLGALVAFIAIASSQSRMQKVVNIALRFLPGKLHDRAARLATAFVDGLASLRSPASLAAVFGLSILAWLFETGMYYVLGTWGFGLATDDGTGRLLPFYAYMLATAFVNLSTLIPQGPGYVGVFDAIAKVVLVGAFGVPAAAATSYVLVLHYPALLLPITLLGFFYMGRESLSWKELTGLEKTRAKASQQAHEMEGPLTDIELVQEGKMTTGEAEEKLEQAGEEPPDSPPPDARSQRLQPGVRGQRLGSRRQQ
jgi:uncharacterized protein (TIRG00374 family)